MEFQQIVGTAIISALTLIVIVWVPLSEYWLFIWVLSITLVGGDAVTTSLFGYFDEEEQSGYTRNLCGAQPSLRCMVFTRLPIVSTAVLLYFAWVKSGSIVHFRSVTLPPESIPLMLSIAGGYAVVWNVYGFITPDQE